MSILNTAGISIPAPSIDLNRSRVLVTGAAGFVGAALCRGLLRRFDGVLLAGIDNLNDYYDPALKKYRLAEIEKLAAGDGRFRFCRGDITDRAFIDRVFEEFRPDVVIHLAAQAGVRHSIDHPEEYLSANVTGFFNVMDASRPVRHFVYASSSSVYGSRSTAPFSTKDRTDEPVSFYAATKKTDELLAYTYSSLYRLPSTALRFFTVYGPAGRPDMAYYKFTEKLVRGEKIELYNYGRCMRDFTYIDDIVDGVIAAAANPPEAGVPYAIYNIGGEHPVELLSFVKILTEALLRHGVLPPDFRMDDHLVKVPMQPGDVEITCADSSELRERFGVSPKVTPEEGLDRFAAWYAAYYGTGK